MTKKNSLLAAIGVLSLCTIYAFTHPESVRERVLPIIFPENKPAVAPVYPVAPVVEKNNSPEKTTALDTLPPLEERYDDFINNGKKNPIDLNDPKAITQDVTFDPVTNMYIITEKIGDEFYRAPTYMTFDEYVKWRDKKQQQEYFDRLNGVASAGRRNADGTEDPIAKFDIKNSLIDRLFGGTNVDIKPQGNINLTFGYDYQKIQNPILTLRQQRNGNFDFDMDINMSAQGKIGEKLNLNFNYNTQATFDFDNQMKIHYDPKGFSEDEIIQNIEAGNVSLPLRSSLIKGVQNLFGVKTEFKTGHLRTTFVAAQQRSRQQSLSIQGGAQVQTFDKPIDEYDENRHFFLSHWNRDQFEPSLKCLPVPLSLFTITQMEVWITNDKGQTEGTRDIVALTDMAEPTPFLDGKVDTLYSLNPVPDVTSPDPIKKDIKNTPLPDNFNNKLYPDIIDDVRDHPEYRYTDRVVNYMNANGYRQIRDFEKVNARLLSSSEYTYNEQLGFVSINLNVQPDQVVGIAVKYTYNGSPYKIGEFSDELPKNADTINNPVLFVKMLKSTTANVRYPIWDLMMKNIYAIGTANVDPQEFRFDIMYEDPGKGQKRFLDGTGIPQTLKQRPLIQLFGLDNLNLQGDPGADGIFDFVPGLTINLRSGRIMFPKLEPFGTYLRDTLQQAGATPQALKSYVYSQLYDSTLFRAREYQELNRFTLKGSYKSSTSAEISLGTFNLPQGSVRVSAGGRQLKEGVDYQVDYNIGKVKILDDAILQSGQNVNVSFEDNTLFGFQNRTMIGTRFDYAFSKDFNVGATFMNLFERPLTQKVNFGDDPINNKVYGLDFNISKDAPWLTKLVDKLPLIETKEASSITAQAEVAILDPGYSKAINQGDEKGGTVYLDDFEGSTSNLPLTIPANSWVIASVPQGDEQLFPESKDTTLALGANRAALSWYIADPSARDGMDADDPYTSLIQYQDIFPNRQLTPLEQSSLRPLDITYYPRKRGPYNFESQEGYIDTTTNKVLSEGLTIKGELNKPETRWAGIMRGLNTNDFEAANIEFLEFWVLNPYMDKKDIDPVSEEGSIYFDLGTISEDIMRDSRQFFENAIPTSAGGGASANTRWGRVPVQQPVVNAFDNDPARRPLQDLGLDGLNDQDEKTYFSTWYNKIMSSTISDIAKAEIAADPSNDNFVYFRDQIYESNPPGLLTRYSKFNNQQGNSPVNSSSNLNPSATNLPDGEDLNLDKSLNENESYYRYPIKMTKGPNTIQVGGSSITVDGLKFEDDPILKDLITDTVVFNRNGQYYIWYRFKLPLDYTSRQQFGGIQDFRSIRFIRMVMKGFNERTTLRFATLELGRNQWRRYSQTLKGCGNDDPSVKRIPFDVNAVSIEENSARTPFNYTIPYGIQREQSVGAFPDVLQNEQALALSVCDLEDCDARAIFKSLNLDLRQFKTLKMFVHMESKDPDPANKLDSTDVKAFLRIGSDFVRNYYEYEITIDPSRLEDLGGNRNPDSREYKDVVWKSKNSFDFPLELLIDVKKQRNLQPNWPAGTPYEIVDPNNPKNKVRVVGNPNLGYAKGVMFGVKNSPDVHKDDKLCFEVWINELRLNGFSEQGGYAGQARVDMKLADLGNVSLAGSFTSKGWGSIEQKINQRQREDVVQVDVSTNLELHKLLPEKAGVRIPFYAQYSNTTRTPEYDPYDLDIKLRDKLRDQTDPVKRDSIRDAAQDITVVRGYNFTNVRKERRGNKKVSLPWDISNFSLTYAYNQTKKHNPFILLDQLDQRKGAIDYQYSTGLKPFTPFKKLIKKDKYLKFLSEFNFNPIPNTYGFNTNLERFAGKTTYRFAGEDPKLNTYYNRRFTWDRNYDLGWDIAKSLRFNFDATARSLIDEPYAFDTDGNVVSQKVVRDSIWKNVLKLGRPKNYTHNASLNYTLPFKTIPFMDFITVKASYTAGYTWTAQSLKLQNLDAGPYQSVENSRDLGNVIQNNSVRQINGDMDFTKLYDKSKYLSKINKPGKPASGGGKGKPGKGGANDPAGSNPDNMDPDGLPDKGGRVPAGGGKDMRPGAAGKGKDAVSGGGGGKGSDQLDGASGKDNSTTPPDKNAAKNNLPAGGNNGLNPAIDPTTGRPAANPNTGGLNPSGGGQPGNSSDPNDKGGKSGKDDKNGKGGGNLKGGKDKKERIPTLAERIALRPLMLVRKARFTYSENFSTVVPGFTPDTKLLGQSNGFSAPGWAFIGGIQPNSAWLDESARNGWITYRPELNQQVLRNYTQNMDGGLTIEPFTDFRVEITANRQYMRNSTELYKDQNITSLSPDSVDFQHKAARDFGSFTVSYFSMNTLFNNDINGLFNRYESYRPIISQRLGVLADDTSPHEDPNYANGYTKGRGGSHQEVLIPAFIAAYTEKDPNSVGLDLFKTRPALNWKLSYNGLSKVGNLSKVFSSVQITHGYKNTLTVNSYNTDIFYDPANPYDTGSDNYKLNYNYIARYEIPQVVINEQMQPLLGLDVKLKNDMTFKADFKKSRMLALSLVDYQLAETRSSGYTVGFGYRVKNVNIKFLTGKKSTKGKKSGSKKKNAKKPAAADKAGAPPTPTGGAQQGNDLNFKFDFDLRDDITINHRLDVPGDAIPTRGARTISINPSVEYALNKRLKLRLFTDYRKTVPKTSQSFPITTIQSGITVQFSLN